MSNQLNTPVEIDAAIDAQLVKLQKAEQMVSIYESRIAKSWRGDEEKLAEALAILDREAAEDKRLQALYTGWPRYWHVTNNNGHIHTSQHCTSCFPETRYGWRTDLSGLTPEQVVEREAYNACSVCMPIAPAEQRAARQRYTQEQRDAKKADKDAKATEKARKAAERAQKLMVKVEAAYESLGGYEAAMSLPDHGDGSLYHAVYAFGDFAGRKPIQDSVANVMMADHEERRTGKRASYDKDPRKIIAEARERGLI